MSVNDWLMAAALVASMANRQWVAAALAATYCAQSLADYAGWLDPYGYYLSVALIDALFVLVIHLQRNVSRQLRIIQLICVLFIPVQIGGLVMWYLFEPPLVYNITCSALYLALIASIIFGDKGRARANKNSKLRLFHGADRGRGVARVQADKGIG